VTSLIFPAQQPSPSDARSGHKMSFRRLDKGEMDTNGILSWIRFPRRMLGQPPVKSAFQAHTVAAAIDSFALLRDLREWQPDLVVRIDE
jgi:hypothetical protein